ncbi:SIR2 family protein [Methylophilus luteus]|uniref:SIR2 family protein n=1 Tax=Methylophilus luteus TaxID=640108 RepID=A0ABW3F633_9PROT
MIWGEKIIDDIARRKAVIFFGAGVSMNSLGRDGVTRPKSWVQFLNVAANRLQPKDKTITKQLIKQNDLLTACEVIRRVLGDEFIELVKDEFQTPGYGHTRIHELLWLLDLRINITPNFDNIYDSYVSAASQGTINIKNYTQDDIADSIRRNAPVLIKSHGTVTEPNNLIFTRVDYAKARNSHRDFYELLDSLLRTHTFIFIGCGLDDPDIRLLLEDYCFRHKYAQKHYFVLPSKRYSTLVKQVYEDSLKLKILEYKYSDTTQHSNLLEELEHLVTSVNQKRIEISLTQQW